MSKEQTKWEIKEHSMQIADTGDYGDGHVELTNGTISLVTRDGIDVDNPISQVLVHMLNSIDAKWENWIEDDLRYQLHVMSENCEKWKNMAGRLHEKLGSSLRFLGINPQSNQEYIDYEELKKLLL